MTMLLLKLAATAGLLSIVAMMVGSAIDEMDVFGSARVSVLNACGYTGLWGAAVTALLLVAALLGMLWL